MNPPLHAVTRYRVQVVAHVEAKVAAEISFTDADVREWLGVDGLEDVDPEEIEEYAAERISEDGDLEVLDVTYWKDTTVNLLGTEREMQVPPEFVALPGTECAL